MKRFLGIQAVWLAFVVGVTAYVRTTPDHAPVWNDNGRVALVWIIGGAVIAVATTKRGGSN